jgi:hypothetical protein
MAEFMSWDIQQFLKFLSTFSDAFGDLVMDEQTRRENATVINFYELGTYKNVPLANTWQKPKH